MNSTRIRIRKLNFHEQPHQLDSTRIVLRHYGNGICYHVMISNLGTPWNYTSSGLRMQKLRIGHNKGISKRNKGVSYALISTGRIPLTTDSKIRELLHRCVATIWVRVPRKLARLNIKLQIDHRNGNRFDNRPCNLRWCTQSQNIRYSYRARNGLPV